MKTKIALGIVSLVALGMTIYAIKLYRNGSLQKKLQTISDEGYETAHDILYPLKRRKLTWH